MTAAPTPETPFDLNLYLRLPRVGGLTLSPDGGHLVTSASLPGPDGKKFVSALWELDPAGGAGPRRLTRSAPGESNAAFLPDGSLLFTSTRTDPEAPAGGKDDEEVAGIWLLPAGGGEARLVATTPAGVELLRLARDAGTVVYRTGVFPGADDLDADQRRHQARKDAGVNAQLFESYPIRLWDHYLGPREPRLLAAPAPAADTGRLEPGRVLTPSPGRALDEVDVADDPRNPFTRLVAIDIASGQQRCCWTTLARRPGGWPARRTGAWRCASGSGTATRSRPPTSPSGCSTCKGARAATCFPASASGRWSRSGRPAARRSSSSPTRTDAPRCSGWRSAATSTGR
jgi:dipeptidyl aminopeptidase/acylaminoacyl peptidase